MFLEIIFYQKEKDDTMTAKEKEKTHRHSWVMGGNCSGSDIWEECDKCFQKKHSIKKR